MRNRYYLFVTPLLLFLVSTTARAQGFDIYAQFGNIMGEATEVDHEDWTDIIAFSHGISNQFIIGGGQQSDKPLHSPVSLTLAGLDKSTLPLIDAMNNGDTIGDVVIDFVTTLGARRETIFKVELTTVFVTSIAYSGTDFWPTPSFTLLYEKIKLTYWPVEQDGSLGTAITSTWDVVNQTPLAATSANLTVRADGNDVVFGWQTLSESGHYGFEIQHQENGEFKRAAYVPATGWSSLPLQYQVRVRGLDEGIHVFRLASLSLGGGVAYSEELTVSLGVPDGLTLALDAPWPNPFSGRLNLALSTATDEQARISVWDMLGREVAVVYEGPVYSGVKSRFVFDSSNSLPSGSYIVRVKTDRRVVSEMVTLAH